MLANKLMSALSGGAEDKLYVDDVFSTYTYTGNGSPQTINNGIDLAGKGGLVWTKARNQPYAGAITSSGVGFNYALFPHQAGSKGLATIVSALSNGYSLATDTYWNWNNANDTYVSWTFRKAPKFFDVVTYMGNGASSRAIAHSLGQEAGMVMTKATSTTGDWNTYHRSATGDLVLNSTAAQTGSKALVNSATATTFTVSEAANTNAVTYVAYLFAHDPSADGLIQCGSYTGNGSAPGPIVNLGWEPQYLMIKNASGTGNWQIIDSMRGMPVGSADATLQANLANAESSVDYISPTATGFQLTSTSSEVNASGSTYIYMAIRRPNKPPTLGTQVYNAIARTGTGAAATVTGVGFAPDFITSCRRDAPYKVFATRLQGNGVIIQTDSTNAEITSLQSLLWGQTVDGIGVGVDTGVMNSSGVSYVNHFFKRAPGVFDVVCYAGDGQNSRVINHGLGAVPTFAFIKERNGTAGWTVKLPTGNGSTSMQMALNSSVGSTLLFGDPSTATTFSVASSAATGNTNAQANNSNKMYVAFLFASCPGISKVGTYTGNGATQTIDCGFATGARFILIKRVDNAGDWYVWDTARGITSANDPHLSLNTTAAEVTTDDSVDPASSGFIVNQVAATNINVSGGQYIFLSIA